MVEFIQPTTGHLEELAANMRADDVREIWATGFTDVRQALRISTTLSTHMATVVHGDRVLCVFGVAPVSLAGRVGSPWLLGTPLLLQNLRALVPRVQPYIHTMLRAYPTLENHVHAHNTASVMWLRRAGFTLHPAAPHGPRGEHFHRFEMRA